jgi:enolase
MSGTTITSVSAWQVFTHRGHPGVEAVVKTENGAEGRAICTAGVSIGSHEVKFNYDKSNKWGGMGVQGAADNVNKVIAPVLVGMDAADQLAADNAMLSIMPDAKVKLGGNATASVSAAVLKAGAAALGIPLYQHIGGAGAMCLPVPGAPAYGGGLRYGGGYHPTGNKPTVTFQCYGFDSFADASYAGWEIQKLWREKMRAMGVPPQMDLAERSVITAGFVKTDEELFELMAKTAAEAGYEGKVGIQMDAAADTYYNPETKIYKGLIDGTPRTRDQLMDLYKYLVKTYPLVVLEDPFNENDYESHALLCKEIDIQVTGDDLFTTNVDRVKQGIEMGAANCVLLKVNQIGSISEALEMIHYAYKFGYGVMPCESRGEGPEIADYCVGINAGSVRECAVGMRANRFLEIERELGPRARFLGPQGLMGRRFHK